MIRVTSLLHAAFSAVFAFLFLSISYKASVLLYKSDILLLRNLVKPLLNYLLEFIFSNNVGSLVAQELQANNRRNSEISVTVWTDFKTKF